MLSKLTLLGLHRYSDGDIWSELTFPEGIDKETAVNEILRQCSEFCVLYPDLDYLKAAIKAWGIKWYFTFDKWNKAINYDYEPLWNLDVKIDITDDGNKNGRKNGSKSENTTGSTSETTSGSTTDGTTETTSGTTSATTDIDGTNTHQNAAYDSDEFKNAEKDIRDDTSTSSGTSSGSKTVSSTGSSSGSLTGSTTGSLTGTTSEGWTEDDSNEHYEYRRGNQGVTKSQELLLDELNVRTWNLYDHIADIFAHEFCITMYV